MSLIGAEGNVGGRGSGPVRHQRIQPPADDPCGASAHARRRGRIVNVSSVLGFLPAPYMGLYSASKHAVEGLTESLDHEVRQFGIRATLVEPSFTRTSLGRQCAAGQRADRRVRPRANACVARRSRQRESRAAPRRGGRHHRRRGARRMADATHAGRRGVAIAQVAALHAGRPRRFEPAENSGSGDAGGNDVIVDPAQRRQTAKPPTRPGRQSAKAGETTVSALLVQAPTFDTA